MTPIPQQMTLDQLPDDALAIHGWNQYRALEGARRQAQLCEQNIVAISQELDRRAQAKQEADGKEAVKKKSEHEALIEGIAAKLAERNGHALPAAVEEDKKES